MLQNRMEHCKGSDPSKCVGRNFVDKEKEEKSWERRITMSSL